MTLIVEKRVDMKKVLITGLKSYVGKSFEQWVRVRHPGEMQIEFVSLKGKDWMQSDWRKFDTVIHVAGLVHKNENKIGYEEYDNINHLLSRDVAKKAKADGVNHFIFMSTKGVYKPNTPIVDETTVPAPTKFYGKSKLVAEKEIIPLIDENFKVSILRPPTIYGENCNGNFKSLEKLSKRIHIFPNIDNDRSMIYIWNFCEFLYLQITEPLDDIIYYPQNREYSGTLKLLTGLWSERGEKYRLSAFLAFVVKFLIYTTGNIKLKTMFSDSKYDSKMSNHFKYRYCVYTFDESIRRIVDSK